MSTSWRNRAFVYAILAILLVSSFAGLASFATASSLASGAGTSSTHVAPAPSALPTPPHAAVWWNITGNVTWSPTTLGTNTYLVQSNVNVLSGGTLWIYHEKVVFDSFTATACGCPTDLLSRFGFIVGPGGHVFLIDSTITTNVNGPGVDPKLNLSIVGGSSVALTFGSALAFPGSIFVNGASSLFVNRSAITGNPDIGSAGLPANVTSDDSYAPSLLVTGGSKLVTVDSDLNGTYKSSLAGGPQLNNTFVDSGPAITVPTSGNVSTVSLVPATPLGMDTYDAWSSGAVGLLADNPNAGPVTANVTFHLYGAHAWGPTWTTVTIPSGTTTVWVALPPSFVRGTLDSNGLASLLTAFSSGTPYTWGRIVVGAASASGVILNQTWISLTPLFHYDLVVSGASTYIGVDTMVSVNWQDLPTAPGQAYTSNKFLLQGSSVAYLVNTTSWQTAPTGYANTSAFLPDAASYFLAFSWVELHAQTPSLAPAASAMLNATSAVPAGTGGTGNPYNVTANDFASPAWLQANAPDLYGALNYEATRVLLAPSYGLTNAAGNGSLAVIVGEVTASSVPKAIGFGEYNVTVSETGANITGGPAQGISSRASPPSLCPWPTTCVALLPAVSVSLTTADMQIVSCALDPATASSLSPLTYFEGMTVTADITVRDANWYAIGPQSGSGLMQFPLTASDAYLGGIGSGPYNTSYTYDLTSSDFTGGNVATIQVPFVVPAQSAGSHTVWCAIDPLHTQPWPTKVDKVAAKGFTSAGVPFYTTWNGASMDTGVVATQMLDCTTGQQVSGSQENTGNCVILEADVTNTGDYPAALGSTAVQFELGVGGSWTWVGNPVLNSAPVAVQGTWRAELTTTVLCTCSTIVQAWVNFTYPNPGPANFPTPFGFVSPNPSNVPTIDYTSLVLSNTTAHISVGTPLQVLNYQGKVITIGSQMSLNTTVVNKGGLGTAATAWLSLWVVSGTRSYWMPLSAPAAFSPGGNLQNGGRYDVWANWTVTESAMALGGPVPGARTFGLFIGWSNGAISSTANTSDVITIGPSLIKFVTVSPFAHVDVYPGDTPAWTLQVELLFNGSGGAGLDVYFQDRDLSAGINESYALNQGIGSNITSARSGVSTAVDFGLPTNNPLPAGEYDLVVYASYNGGGRFYTIASAITVHSAATCSTFSFCNPLFLILIIAIIAVAVIVAVVLFMGRAGKGRLVECGECGELIPENAPSCPKCGAEFETEMVRCSRCASTIPSQSKVCPECSALLLGKEGAAGPEEQQRKDYSQSIDRFRAEGRKELGENYSEGAFWDWWKRQPSYLSYSAFKLQQAQGTRTGMSAPAAQKVSGDEMSMYQGGPPPGAMGMPPMGPGGQPPMAPPGAPPPGAVPGAGPGAAGMKACSSCGREINADFLVCPFCGAATR